MTASECIKGRRSVRKFAAKPVEKEVLESVVATAAFAPSWKNTQVTRYIAVTDTAVKEAVAESIKDLWIGNTEIIKNAPVLMIVTLIQGRSGYERDGSFSTSKGTHFQSFDSGLATEAFCLAAHEQGLGSVILGIFDEKKVAEHVTIPEGQEIAALVALGYPAEEPVAPKRKEVSDLLTIV